MTAARSLRQMTPNGFSLVELMVVLGIVGIIAAGIATAVGNQIKGIKSLEQRMAYASLRTSLLQSIDCGKTMAATPCAANGDPVDLRDWRDQSLLGAAGTGGVAGGKKFNDQFYLRATCDITNSTIKVEAALVSSGGVTPQKDAANSKKVYDWNVKPHNPIFGTVVNTNGVPLCQSYFGAAVAAAIPPGLVAPFATAACPPGWSVYAAAAGRYIMGPSATRPAGTVFGSSTLSPDQLPPHRQQVTINVGGTYLNWDWDWINLAQGSYGLAGCGQNYTGAPGHCLLAANGDLAGPFSYTSSTVLRADGSAVAAQQDFEPPSVALLHCRKN